MAGFDNLFDAAITQADDTIRRAVGASATVTSDAISGVTLSGVFDDPEDIGHATPGIRVEGISPSLFVKPTTVRQPARLDLLDISEKPLWADRIGPNDYGSCHIWLGTGSLPAATQHR